MYQRLNWYYDTKQKELFTVKLGYYIALKKIPRSSNVCIMSYIETEHTKDYHVQQHH